jgi:hypothetical protein
MKIGNSQCNQQNEGGQAKRAEEQKNDSNQEQSRTKQKLKEFGFG